MIKRALMLLASAALGGGVAACGGSSKASGVLLAPSAGATSTTVSTPKVPPALSKKPAVTVPKGPAPNHLVVKDLVKGDGATARSNSTVTVNYVGVLYKTGKEFDSSWSRSQPATFPLSGLIKGWAEGMVGMRVGGRRELIIPPSLGYGSKSQSSIPANSTLVFVVDLLSVA